MLYAQQTVAVDFVIVTEDSEAGMEDIHDRRPVVPEPEDALRWLDPETTVEEASTLLRQSPYPPKTSLGGRWTRAVNRADPSNNGKHLLVSISESA